MSNKYRSPFRRSCRITQNFGVQSDMYAIGYHNGLDVVCDDDWTLVSISDGVVSDIGYEAGGFGNYIIVDMSDGNCYLYGHMKYSPTLKVGDEIKTGEKISIMGDTGFTTGSQLHLQIEKGEFKIAPKGTPPSWLLDPIELVDFKKYDNDNFSQTTSKTDSVSILSSFEIGDAVKINQDTVHYATGQSMPKWVKEKVHFVKEKQSGKSLLGDENSNGIYSWVWDKDLIPQVLGNTESSKDESHDSKDIKLYTVKPGDSFWSIAESELGSGAQYEQLAKYNGMTSGSVIHPGDVLQLP